MDIIIIFFLPFSSIPFGFLITISIQGAISLDFLTLSAPNSDKSSFHALLILESHLISSSISAFSLSTLLLIIQKVQGYSMCSRWGSEQFL